MSQEPASVIESSPPSASEHGTHANAAGSVPTDENEEQTEEIPDYDGSEANDTEANEAAFEVWDAGQTIAYSAALVSTFGQWRQNPTAERLFSTMPNGFSAELMNRLVDDESRRILADAADAFFWEYPGGATEHTPRGVRAPQMRSPEDAQESWNELMETRRIIAGDDVRITSQDEFGQM